MRTPRPTAKHPAFPTATAGAAASFQERAEVPQALRWNLQHIFDTANAWEAEFRRVELALESFAADREKLGASTEQLRKFLHRHDEAAAALDRVYVYAHLKRDEDTRDADAQALAERASRLGTRFAEASSFIEPEILALGRSRIEALLQEPQLQTYHHWLRNLLRKEEHTLSPREEELLAMAGELARTPRHVFGMLNDADLVFGKILDDEGREVEITHGRYSTFLESPNRRVRRDAWNTLYDVYEAHKNTFAGLLGGAVKRDVFAARARKYASSLEASLHPANLSETVYRNLLRSIDEGRSAIHRSMTMRKRILGLEELRVYDLHAPLTRAQPPSISWDEAKALLFEGLAPLGAEYVRDLLEGLEKGWVDVHETKGKRSGAYSWGAYGTHPYVLLNYQGTLDHLFTLAHEVGHAMHHLATTREQAYVNSHYPIFLAEVASTTNEALLLDYLLRVKKDPEWQGALLTQAIDQIRGTVITQAIFASFELEIHEMAERGEPLTVASLSEAYRQAFTRTLGPELTFDDRAALGWTRVPHFYNNFYVFQYATGYAAAIALSRRILREGEPARRDYLGFLSAGDSNFPLEILKNAGVDLGTPQPIRDTLDHLDALLGRLEEHLAQQGLPASVGGGIQEP